MIEILLIIIIVLLFMIARGLWVINDNIFHRNQRAKTEHADVLLVLERIGGDVRRGVSNYHGRSGVKG